MTDTTSAITVIVPAYNTQSYIERCAQSILGQTLAPMELILVDDGSTDGTHAICDSLAQQNKCVRVIHKQNGGLSDARNAGIDASHGKWLLFVDSDDYLDPNALQLLASAQERTGADMVVAGFVSVGPSEKVLWYDSPGDYLLDERGFWQARYHTGDIQVPGDGTCLITSWGTLFRSSLFAKERFDRGKVSEDEFIIHRLVAQSAVIATISDCCYYYTIREDGIMGTRDAEGMLDGAEAYNLRASHLISKGMRREALFSLQQSIHNMAHAHHHRQSTDSALRGALLAKDVDTILRSAGLDSRGMVLRLRLALLRLSPTLYEMAANLRNTVLRRLKR